MAKTEITDFEKRLSRIDRIHEAGGAFEASGALGRSYFDSMRPKARRGLPLRGIALFLVGAFLLKAAILAQIGATEYAARVDLMAQGNLAQQLGGWVLHADAPTRYLAGVIGSIIH
ncbi:hypothetical protein DL1_15090 [Thioclava dalianensis]|uniref:Uncharacterized protein n=1 Tax=Thioclava dalianensis TaxID=1185766 RepID=A0A074U066_9RHOB|nr:hypothetical protein [Thioclava dalianensis]KEP68082.1 hypothetical protein DL1_15090 [Thioclava dalianensis]SFM90739.1 hypothetical protein SAMN05216224_101841 [Thioclava dalianensis]